jgi:hypothetical protein
MVNIDYIKQRKDPTNKNILEILRIVKKHPKEDRIKGPTIKMEKLDSYIERRESFY